MKNYYMFQQTSSRKKSAVERITDPETVANYLCGYSLRICTLYLLWIHLVITVSILCTFIIAHTYVTIHLQRDETPNSTIYTVKANSEKLFNIDMFSKGIDGPFKLVFNKLNKLFLMVPYVVAIFTNIIWFVILLVFCEIIPSVFNLMGWSWISASILTIVLLKDAYRFAVLYSYFRMIRGDCFPLLHRSPRFLKTRSPHSRSPLNMTTTAKTKTTSEESLAKISLSSKASDKDSEDNG